MNAFQFKLKTHLFFGAGESSRIADLLKEQDFNSVGIIIDRGVFEHPQINKITTALKDKNITFKVYRNTIAEPTYDQLEEVKKEFSGQNIVCMIGIGGGSTLDLAKGVATLLTNHGPAIQFKGFPKLLQQPLPVIAIPTTAGTGSEVTYNAVFTDSNEQRKLGINSEYNFPKYAIIDPLFLENCPEKVMVSSGMDALTHALESYVSKNATPLSRMFSIQALKMITKNIVPAIKENNPEAQANLFLGSYIAGSALINSGPGPAAAMSYPIGVHYHVPHGLAGALFLADVVRINIKKSCYVYSQIYDEVYGIRKMSEKTKSIRFWKELEQISKQLNVPQDLTLFGMKKEDIEKISEEVVTGLKGAIAQNPVEFTKNDVIKILKSKFAKLNGG